MSYPPTRVTLAAAPAEQVDGISRERQTRDDASTSVAGTCRSLLTGLFDLTSNLHHSQDFTGARAEYIFQRVRLLALLFAILVQCWIPLDWILVDGRSFMALTVTRLLASLSFLALALWRPSTHDLRLARVQLALLVLINCVFYYVARHFLESGANSWALMGYGFFPLVIAATLAVFPLTLVEGLLLTLPVFATVIVVEHAHEALYSVETVGALWLLLLLTCIATWAELSHLQMLLKLYREATRDALTGLFNRRALMHRLEEEIDRARRYVRPFSVLMFDLDKFKRVNDTHGHPAGDAVLRHFAGIVEQALRRSDLVGRYGGEEYLALLPETAAQVGRDIAERIRVGCHDRPAAAANGTVISFTTSIGVAEFRADETAEKLLKRVDDCLYAAKNAGRDRVVIAN